MAKPDIKALVVNHGEKIAFGTFAVIVLGVLTVGTSWARYSRTPDQLKQIVANAEAKISDPSNIWPKADEETYKVVDYSERSRVLFTPLASLASGRFDFSTPLFHPLYRKDEPKREPVYEPVQYLITNVGRAPLSIMTEAAAAELQQTSEPTKVDDEKPSEMSEDGDLAARPSTPSPVGLGNGMPRPGPGAAAHNPTMSAANRPSNGHSSPLGTMLTNMPGGMSSGSLAPQGPDVRVRGVKYISIRGVFPLRKQIENYKRALHISEAEAASLVEIADFVLERQVAMPGPDPWKESEWKRVSLTTSEEILDECTDLDPYDPVPTALKDPVITMNLPLRLLFAWGENATHPKIKDDELKRDEMELENKLLETLADAATEANLPETEKQRQRGLARKQRDVKGLVNQVRGNAEATNFMKEAMKKMGGSGAPGMGSGAPMGAGAAAHMGPGGGHMGGGPRAPGNNPMNMMGGLRGTNTIERLAVNNTRYLLFRYLDFDVESGNAYRYRVRLQLRNPNFELSAEELGSGDIEITKGEERETPWSNTSNAQVVPSTVNYYLDQIAREPYHEEKVRWILSKPVAQLSIFDWDAKFGTVITDLLNIPALGGFIGEEKKDVKILNLAEETLEKEKHKFSTLNVLVDVESDIEISPADHPDLKLNPNKQGKARLGLLPEALIAMESGEIEALDPFSEQAEEKGWEHRVDVERKQAKIGDKVTATPLNRLDELTKDQDDKTPGKKKKRRRNPRRGAATAMATPGMPGMPGMPMPAGHGGPPSSKKKKSAGN